MSHPHGIRRCRKCGRELPSDFFSQLPGQKRDDRWCRECRAQLPHKPIDRTAPRRAVLCADCGVPIKNWAALRCIPCAQRERQRQVRSLLTPPNPSGICQCGCGQVTPIAKNSNHRVGKVQGEHLRYCRNHHTRRGYHEEDRGFKTPCWIFEGQLTKDGYAPTSVRHRVYAEKKGPVPKGMHLDHLCFQTDCINADHAEPVTPAVNKQRASGTKMTPNQVREIRALVEPINFYEVGRRYRISGETASAIYRRKVWKNVE